VPPLLSPQRGSSDMKFHIEEVNISTRIEFIDGRVPHHPSHKPDVRQSIETEVLGLQADSDDAANVPRKCCPRVP